MCLGYLKDKYGVTKTDKHAAGLELMQKMYKAKGMPTDRLFNSGNDGMQSATMLTRKREQRRPMATMLTDLYSDKRNTLG